MSPTPLEHRIRALVRLNGPMSVHDYMGLCLGDPEHGYYMAREPFGEAGDFFTAPIEWQQRLWPTEEFELARSRVPVKLPESDLFTGIER